MHIPSQHNRREANIFYDARISSHHELHTNFSYLCQLPSVPLTLHRTMSLDKTTDHTDRIRPSLWYVIIMRHEWGLDRPVSAYCVQRSTNLVYNSALFLGSCCCSYRGLDKLTELNKWFSMKLSLNFDKTSFMIFATSDKTYIYL
jgi:hypothetical protein